MSEKVKLCELCKEQSATVLCAECCKCYCNECSEFVHSRTSLKGHKTEAIPEGVIVDARCPLHNDNPLEMFCVDEVKLCCSTCTFRTEDLHTGHNVVKVSDISQDNEVFSASEVRKRFVDVLKCDDELDRKIEETIESIRSEGNSAREKVKQTFEEAQKKLKEEERKIMEELERICNESEEVLQKNLGTLREIREYSRILNDADTVIRGKEISRLMELNLVCSMEKQRRTMEELHGAMMTDLKIGWDSEERKLSFTKTLFNGAPVPNNISFPSVSSREMEISWDCDLSRMSEEDQRKVKYVVEMKKGVEEERGWKEVYSGTENKFNTSGLDKDIEYNVRVKCVIGDLQGGWSDAVKVKTKNLTINSEILVGEENGNVLEGKLFEWSKTRKFELLYRGTRDGFGGSDFHRACDNKGKTLVLVKNTSGHIFGGFASIPWNSPSSCTGKQAPGSFIFTLTNMHRIQPTKFNLKDENGGYAVWHDKDWGPIFGSSWDIIITSNCNTNADSFSGFPGTYNDKTGKGNSIYSSNIKNNKFQVQELEVFKVNT